MNVKDKFEGLMIYLSPFFIDFYQGMKLLTEKENKKFPLKSKIVGTKDKGALGRQQNCQC